MDAVNWVGIQTRTDQNLPFPILSTIGCQELRTYATTRYIYRNICKKKNPEKLHTEVVHNDMCVLNLRRVATAPPHAFYNPVEFPCLLPPEDVPRRLRIIFRWSLVREVVDGCCAPSVSFVTPEAVLNLLLRRPFADASFDNCRRPCWNTFNARHGYAREN